MNTKASSLKMSLLVAAALMLGGCSTVPAGYTVVVQNDHVIWEAMGRPKLERLAESPALPNEAATTSGEFPGHPLHGLWSAPMTIVEGTTQSGPRAEVAFLRELARSDGDVYAGPVVTPSETAVATR